MLVVFGRAPGFESALAHSGMVRFRATAAALCIVKNRKKFTWIVLQIASGSGMTEIHSSILGSRVLVQGSPLSLNIEV